MAGGFPPATGRLPRRQRITFPPPHCLDAALWAKVRVSLMTVRDGTCLKPSLRPRNRSIPGR